MEQWENQHRWVTDVEWCENCNSRRAVCRVGHRNMTIWFCSECESEYNQEYADWLADALEDR